jgi:hypothetical protein
VAALDHLVVSAATLVEGVASVEAALEVTLTPGGEHPQMGTHNRLMSLGEGLYLEVIAVNPDAPAPGRPRWFDLDNFCGVPRLTNWVIRCGNLKEAHTQAPAGCGEIHDLVRGDYRWRMAIPVDGRLPFGGAFPGMIEWRGPHPAGRLPDAGCRLRRLVLVHPEAAALGAALFRLVDDPGIAIEQGPETALRAEIDTGRGMRLLA